MTAIWHRPITLEEMNRRSEGTLADFLGIRFTSLDEGTLTAQMPVRSHTLQPIGIVHGGANVVLAETVASTAANAVVDIERFYCVGLEINANHIRSVKQGLITAVTKPIHLGRSTQVWEIVLTDDAGRITCASRMTAAVITRRQQDGSSNS